MSSDAATQSVGEAFPVANDQRPLQDRVWTFSAASILAGNYTTTKRDEPGFLDPRSVAKAISEPSDIDVFTTAIGLSPAVPIGQPQRRCKEDINL